MIKGLIKLAKDSLFIIKDVVLVDTEAPLIRTMFTRNFPLLINQNVNSFHNGDQHIRLLLQTQQGEEFYGIENNHPTDIILINPKTLIKETRRVDFVIDLFSKSFTYKGDLNFENAAASSSKYLGHHKVFYKLHSRELLNMAIGLPNLNLLGITATDLQIHLEQFKSARDKEAALLSLIVQKELDYDEYVQQDNPFIINLPGSGVKESVQISLEISPRLHIVNKELINREKNNNLFGFVYEHDYTEVKEDLEVVPVSFIDYLLRKTIIEKKMSDIKLPDRTMLEAKEKIQHYRLEITEMLNVIKRSNPIEIKAGLLSDKISRISVENNGSVIVVSTKMLYLESLVTGSDEYNDHVKRVLAKHKIPMGTYKLEIDTKSGKVRYFDNGAKKIHAFSGGYGFIAPHINGNTQCVGTLSSIYSKALALKRYDMIINYAVDAISYANIADYAGKLCWARIPAYIFPMISPHVKTCANNFFSDLPVKQYEGKLKLTQPACIIKTETGNLLFPNKEYCLSYLSATGQEYEPIIVGDKEEIELKSWKDFENEYKTN